MKVNFDERERSIARFLMAGVVRYCSTKAVSKAVIVYSKNLGKKRAGVFRQYCVW